MICNCNIRRENTADMTYKFTVLIEQDESGSYVASVPSLKSCYTQADTIPEVLERIREAISLCLEVEKDFQMYSKSIDVRQIVVAVWVAESLHKNRDRLYPAIFLALTSQNRNLPSVGGCSNRNRRRSRHSHSSRNHLSIYF